MHHGFKDRGGWELTGVDTLRRRRPLFLRVTTLRPPARGSTVIVEIASAGRRLGIERGFLRVDEARLPLDDLDGLILATPALTLSGEVLTRLTELGIAVIVCDRAYRHHRLAVAARHPFEGGRRLAVQIAASDEAKAELWRQIVAAKISLQAEVLDLVGGGQDAIGAPALFRQLCPAGDPEIPGGPCRPCLSAGPVRIGVSSHAGRAAAERRTQLRVCGHARGGGPGARGSRSAPGAGHPSRQRGQSLCLADDLIEPFRPLVDLTVARLPQAMEAELSAEARGALAEILDAGIGGDGRRYGVRGAMQALDRNRWRERSPGGASAWSFPKPSTRPSGRRSPRMPDPYRLMWMFVLYDLPVSSPAKQKAATKFREYLLDQGFDMVQYSIYKRFCGSMERYDTFLRRIERNLPQHGQVRVMGLTDRQFGAMNIYDCTEKRREKRTKPDQLALF